MKRIIVTILITAILFVNSGISSVLAFDFPTPPPAPTAPPAPPNPPEATSAPTAPPEPTAPPAPWDPTPTPTAIPQETPDEEETPMASSVSSPPSSPSSSPEASPLNGIDDGGNVGDTSIETGDATSTGAVVTDANTNTSASVGGNSDGGISVINSENGSETTNSGSVSIVENNNTYQDNSASVTSNLDQQAVSGQNSSSENVGNTEISTGDSNTTGTIITAVNTNVDGVAVAEFNVVDDQMGDIILDFGAGCLIGCNSGNLLAENSGNGTESQNLAGIDSTVNNGTFQSNDATVENNMTLLADSGTNYADDNTNGDSIIETGDANVSANALTFANNNVEGNVIYAVVNIFGDLIGDIIVPEGFFESCCLADTSVVNSGNGSSSINTGSVNQTLTDNTYQFNNVELDNNLILDANSGGNTTSDNTNGDSSITTGDTTIDAQVFNIANTNLSGGNYWLVLVNEAGNWIGRIIGSDGSFFGGSEGFEFAINEFGEITVVNSDNGSNSTNTGVVDQTINNTLVQTNDAHVTNNIELTANTGNNSASRNTRGDSSITTGDAAIIANIVNFVNNNITGGGKLLVTVINVFGSWFGDFVGPGFDSEEDPQALANNESGGVGGTTSGTNQGSSSSQSSGQNTVVTTVAAIQKTSNLIGGFFGFNFDGSNQATSQVAGVSIKSPLNANSGKKAINVNLAWFLPFVFVGGIVSMIIRRRHAI